MRRFFAPVGMAVLGVWLVSGWSPVLGQRGAAPPAQPPANRVPFTAEQADRGQAVFDKNCAGCHGATLKGTNGGPPVAGDLFLSRWDHQPAGALYSYVRETMPAGRPGSLSAQEYGDVMALILKSNGQAAGSTPLPSDAAQLAAMTLTSNPLPKPGAEIAGTRVRPEVKPPADALALAQAAQRKAKADKLRPVTADMLKNPPEGSWLNWRNTLDAHGFSPLAQINRGNVAGLRTAWSWSLPPGNNEITPIVHDGVLFVAASSYVQAIDATSGELIWQYARDQAPFIVRNIAIYGEKLFVPFGTTMVALNIHTGDVVWEHTVLKPTGRVRLSGPVVAKGKVIAGVSGCSAAFAGGCFITAMDAETGKEAWKFYSIARPGQTGGDSWNGTPIDQRYGGSVWLSGSYDPELDLVFFGTSQTYFPGLLMKKPDAPAGANDGLYTNSTVALKPDTGKLAWHYQHFRADVWDLDWSYERTLATMEIGGKQVRTVTTGGKIGIFDTLDAATGKYLFSYDIGLQDLVSKIDPVTGAKTINPAHEPKPGVHDTICTSVHGGRNWPATAYNPRTGILYVPFAEACMDFSLNMTDGVLRFSNPTVPRPNWDGNVGRVTAFDVKTHKEVWSARRRAQEISAILATGGGLVFEGSRDRMFRASDDKTGKVLWQTRLDASPAAYPISYSVDGVQYVAVTTGGSNALESGVANLNPELNTPSKTATLWVFKLAEK